MKPGKTKKWDFPQEVVAIWRNAPNLTVCPRYRCVGFDKLLAHIRNDKCERCFAVYQRLTNELNLIWLLRKSRN